MDNKMVKKWYCVLIKDRAFGSDPQFSYRINAISEIEASERAVKLHAMLHGDFTLHPSDLEVYAKVPFDPYTIFYEVHG